MERWAGRVAVVTGASSGIGAGIVKDLVINGLVVVGIARRVHLIQDLAKELKGLKGTLHAIKADLRKENDILEVFAWIEKNTPGVDILVNNAGVLSVESLLDGSTDGWKQVLEVNLLGLSICAREAVRSMKKKGADDGIVININSIVGKKVLGTHISMYTATKFAVSALSEALYKELAASGSRIRVTNISPGIVDTEMIAYFNENKSSTETQPSFTYDMNQSLKASDIAQAVNFILSTRENVYIPELTIVQNYDEDFNILK